MLLRCTWYVEMIIYLAHNFSNKTVTHLALDDIRMRELWYLAMPSVLQAHESRAHGPVKCRACGD